MNRCARSASCAIAFVVALCAAPPARADVNRSGDVVPAFTPGPVVDLTGQSVYIGNTPGGVGTVGTLNVTGGGILTAAQIVPGTGGLGTGFVNVTGPGSTVNLTGGGTFNGLDIGSWGTGVMTVSNGGLVACASVAACAFNNIADAAGSTGTLAINGGSVTGLGQLAVGGGALQPGFGTPGANTTATLSITNGGLLSSNGFNSVAANSGQTGRVTGNVTIDGAGSTWLIGRDLAGGGSQAGLYLAPNANAVANMTLSNGGNLTITGARSNPATDSSLPFLNMSGAAGASSTMTVTTGASVVLAGDTGVINVGAGSGGTATLNITAGGTVSGSGPNGLVLVDIGRNGATGTVNVNGAGSQLTVAGVGGQNTQTLDGVGGLVIVGGNNGQSGTLNVTGGGSVVISDNGFTAATGSMGLRIGDRTTNASGTVTVSGAGSSIVVSSTSSSPVTPYVIVGNGGNAQMTISDGATVSVLGNGQRNVVVGNALTGTSVLTMSNGATLVASRLGVADNGGTGTVTIDHSTVNLDGVVFNNGLDQGPFGASVRIARGDGANGLLTMQNGAVMNISNTLQGSSINLGGTSVLPGGTGTLNMSGNSSIQFTGPAAGASLAVGAVSGTGFMTMSGGSTVNVGSTGTANVGGNVGTNGTLTVGGGSSITANVFGIGGNSDSSTGGTGTAVVTGPGSALTAAGASGFVGVGRNGSGALSVTDHASINAIGIGVGRAAGGFGTLMVDNALLNLSGQQTTGLLAGAGVAIGGLGGTGVATIGNGSVVNISNPGSAGASFNVGGTPVSPGGTGVLTVNNSTINVTAAPGLAAVRIGHDGNGIATFNGSTVTAGNRTGPNADGSLVVAGQPGSTGTLALNSGSVVYAGYVGVGATTAGPGGTATLTLSGSTINTNTFEIGAHGLLNGNDGVINATGQVIVAGTIAPGESPGRITINCDLITLPGSILVLDILGSGATFTVDHLRLGNDSTFNLNGLHVIFNFLGDTDPNAFAATGGFDLDNFLQSLDLQTGDVTGLSSVFAPGETWNDVIQTDDITAVSPVYDLSDVQIAPDGTVTVVAAPIPEPSTWAMFALGLALAGGIARRRAR